MEISREDLVALCARAAVPESDWTDRDSAQAQRQMGEAWALLKAGCEFRILDGKNTNNDPRAGRTKRGDMSWSSMKSDKKTLWVQIFFKGFDYHENGGPDWNDGYDFRQEETFYLPTAARLDAVKGGDWY